MGQAADQGDGARGIGKDGVPVLERQVGGDEQGAVFVTAADELEEEVGGSATCRSRRTPRTCSSSSSRGATNAAAS